MGFEDCWRPRNIQEFLQESESCGLNEPVFDDLTDFPLLNWKDPPSLKTATQLRISMAIFSS